MIFPFSDLGFKLSLTLSFAVMFYDAVTVNFLGFNNLIVEIILLEFLINVCPYTVKSGNRDLPFHYMLTDSWKLIKVVMFIHELLRQSCIK